MSYRNDVISTATWRFLSSQLGRWFGGNRTIITCVCFAKTNGPLKLIRLEVPARKNSRPWEHQLRESAISSCTYYVQTTTRDNIQSESIHRVCVAAHELNWDARAASEMFSQNCKQMNQLLSSQGSPAKSNSFAEWYEKMDDREKWFWVLFNYLALATILASH